YQYHCDGSAFASAPDYASADTSASHDCGFADNGTYTVRARIIDKDNGATAYTTDVVVNNVAQSTTLVNKGPIPERPSATVSSSDQSDPTSPTRPSSDLYQYHCDGSAFASAPDYASADTSASHDCGFADNGTYTVRARIIDKDNGATAYTTDVVVN